MLTRLLALTGGLSLHNSKIRLSVETSCPDRSSRQASSDRHLGALTGVQPSVEDQTSSGPRMRNRIRPARPNSRSPPLSSERRCPAKQKPPAGYLGPRVCLRAVIDPLNHD